MKILRLILKIAVAIADIICAGVLFLSIYEFSRYIAYPGEGISTFLFKNTDAAGIFISVLVAALGTVFFFWIFKKIKLG